MIIDSINFLNLDKIIIFFFPHLSYCLWLRLVSFMGRDLYGHEAKGTRPSKNDTVSSEGANMLLSDACFASLRFVNAFASL